MGFEIQDNILIRYTEEPGVTEVTVPDSVTEIKNAAFFNCGNIRKIILPDSITDIGAHAFDSCQKLNEIRLPQNLTHIEFALFRDCHNLKKIIIPEHAEVIESEAFFRTGLQEVIIPEQVRIIGSWAFGGYTSPNLIFHRNQRFTKIHVAVYWEENMPEKRLMDFFDNPSAENFSVLDSKHKLSVAVSYYDTDDSIRAYLKRNIKRAVRCSIDENDVPMLKKFLDTDFVTKKNIDSMIQDAIACTQKGANPEFQMILTDYKYQHFPSDASQITKKLKL